MIFLQIITQRSFVLLLSKMVKNQQPVEVVPLLTFNFKSSIPNTILQLIQTLYILPEC